jgi:hypothetical protein
MAITTDTIAHSPLERLVESAAYEGWLTQQVQEAIEDPRPSVPHSEVTAEWATERAALLKEAEVLALLKIMAMERKDAREGQGILAEDFRKQLAAFEPHGGAH